MMRLCSGRARLVLVSLRAVLAGVFRFTDDLVVFTVFNFKMVHAYGITPACTVL
jgi:hypothetical protein